MKEILTEIIKPFLSKVITYIDTNNYWAASIIIICIVSLFIGLGYILSWALQRKKVKREIDKISLESKEKTIILLEKLQAKRVKYIEQTILIQLSVKLCIDALISNDVTALKQNRDELIDLYFNELSAKFVEYVEVGEIFYDGDRNKIIPFIIDEVIPFLETTRMFLVAVNNQNILKHLQCNMVSLKRFSLNPVLRFAENNMRLYQVLLKHKYYKKLKMIEFEETK